MSPKTCTNSSHHYTFFHQAKDEHVIITVAMDDMAVTPKRAVDAENFKRNFKTFWDITDHGPIGWFLGFHIK